MCEGTVRVLYHPTQRILSVLCGLFTTSLAFSIAALTGHSSGWFYYRKNDFKYFIFEMLKHLKPKYRFDLQIWVGYVRGTNSVRKHLLTITPDGLPQWDWLSDAGAIGAVIGWTQAGLLIVGFFACIYLLINLARELLRGRYSSTGGKLLWPRFAPLKIIYPLAAIYTALLFTITIVFMAGILYGVAKKTEKELDHRCVLWPDWAWWLTIINASMWIVACELLRRERRKEVSCHATTISHAALRDLPL